MMSTPRRHSLPKRFAAVSPVALLAASDTSHVRSRSYDARDVTRETSMIVDVAASVVQSTLDGATYHGLDPTSRPDAFKRICDGVQFVCGQRRIRRRSILERSGADAAPPQAPGLRGRQACRDAGAETARDSFDQSSPTREGEREPRASSGPTNGKEQFDDLAPLSLVAEEWEQDFV